MDSPGNDLRGKTLNQRQLISVTLKKKTFKQEAYVQNCNLHSYGNKNIYTLTTEQKLIYIKGENIR